MKTHNAIIYHCLTCGSVVHADPKAEPPQCCAHEMVKAAAETVREGDAAREDVETHCEPAPPLDKIVKKPR